MADLEQTIEKFYAKAVNIDFARKHQWRITEIKNNGLIIGDPGSPGLPYIYAQTGTLPGREVTNVPINFHGLEFNLPGNAKYTNSAGWEVTWRLDQALNIRRLFEDWNYAIFDDRSTSGQTIRGDDSQLTMVLYDQAGTEVDTYRLFGLYPVSVGAVEYDIGTDGEVQTFTTTLAYHYFKRTKASYVSNWEGIDATPESEWGAQPMNTLGSTQGL